MPCVLDIVLDIVQNRKDLVYREPLNLNVEVISNLMDRANAQGLDNTEWLPGVSLWHSLEYARITRLEKAKLTCSEEKYNNMCALATLLGMDDEWKAGVRVSEAA